MLHKTLYIIYTGREMLLSKERYGSWHEIQDQYADFKTSLGPWEPDEVIDYLACDHPGLSPSATTQVEALLASESLSCVLTLK